MDKGSGRVSDLRYLQLLARQYPNTRAASSEIINLQAILNLPKGTEHFMSDLHGEMCIRDSYTEDTPKRKAGCNRNNSRYQIFLIFPSFLLLIHC